MLNVVWDYHLSAFDSPFFAVDNGAYYYGKKELEFDNDNFIDFLDKLKSIEAKPDFIVIPDVLYNKEKTLDFAHYWIPNLKKYKWPLYMVLQDGMIPHDTVLFQNHVKGFFLGGSHKWKWKNAEMWVEYVHACKLQMHFGGCGKFKELLKAKRMGFDSIDSASFQKRSLFDRINSFRNQDNLKITYRL